MTSHGLYPSADPLTKRIGRFPSWAEYMAEFGKSIYIPEQTLIQDHSYDRTRGKIDDSLPIYYDAGPIYENDEDGWVEVRAKRWTPGGNRNYKKKSKKAEKKEKEQIQQQVYFAKSVSFSGNADLLDA